MKLITETQIWFHLSLSCATVSPSCILISAKIFFTLFIHFCFGLFSGFFPKGFHFNTAFTLDYLTLIHGHYYYVRFYMHNVITSTFLHVNQPYKSWSFLHKKLLVKSTSSIKNWQSESKLNIWNYKHIWTPIDTINNTL